MSPGGGPGDPWSRRLGALVAALTILRAILASILPLSGDEAYYWDCSRHLDWTYFDQPPLVIWAMIPFRAVLGETSLAVRAPALVSSALLAAFLPPLMQRLGGTTRHAFHAYLLMHAMPVFLFGGFYASTDNVMITAFVGATWAAVAISQGERRAWWGFGLACGLGFLGKFPVVLVAVPVALGIAAVAAPFVQVVLGEGWGQAAPSMPSWPRSLTHPTNSPTSNGRPR